MDNGKSMHFDAGIASSVNKGCEYMAHCDDAGNSWASDHPPSSAEKQKQI